MPNSNAPKVAIVGGGVAGLAAAIHLHRLAPETQITIFEASGRAGGVLETIYDSPYLIERSADNFATLLPDALELCKLTGYTDQLISPQQNGRQAFVLSRGRILPIPVGFSLVQPTRVWPILTTRVLSWPGKFRMLGEYFVTRRDSTEDESLQSFATRRLGREAFESLVEPIVSGIFTADPARLSMQATLPQFVKMEREHGGLIRGYLAARREDAAAVSRRASGARYDQFTAPRLGMSHWIDHLVKSLPTGCLQLNQPVVSIERAAATNSRHSWLVKTAANEQKFDGLILATPVQHSARMLSSVEPTIASNLSQIEYASSAVVVAIVDRRDIRNRVDGFGLIVPAKERRPVLAISYTSNKYAGRAPDDQLLLRIFLGGATHPEVMDNSDDELIATASQQLREILGWSGTNFRWQAVVRWSQAMPQYHVGHNQRLAETMERVRAAGPIRLCGAGYSGVGIPQTIRSARIAVEELSKLLDQSFSERS
ncbi:MAG: protoporphyrinogen oxidase [Pirellulaceae bacterium]|nr:protoporphyrinogen oxidase [Pirellulaceae bacterium]